MTRPLTLSLVLLATILALLPQPATAEGAAPLPTLQGEAALAHLRNEGLDGSLAEALTAARYSARPVPGRPDEIVAIDPIFAQQAYIKASDTTHAFGFSVAISGDTLVVGAPHGGNIPAGTGAVYVFVRSADVWSQQAYLKASNPNMNAYFGWSVAISGDTLVVGAVGEDSYAQASGAAYVFVRSAGVWSQQAYLKASNTVAHAEFGSSVAISGDTLVVGATYENWAGAAYVFVRSASVWSQQAYLKGSNTEYDDLFGRSVAISGDTLVVGAFSENSNATGVNGDQWDNSADGSGAAYVFVRSAGVWSQQAYIKASNTEADDRFGWSVAISGDTLVVGAYAENSNATGVNGDQSDNSADESGAAYVFVRSAGVWSQQAYLKASNTEAFDIFGGGVAISGDTLVVAAPWECSNATGVDGDQSNNSAPSAGAAYVFVRSAGAWSQQAYLKASNTDPWDTFGWSVAISGDVLVVGAYTESSNATGVNGDQSNNLAPLSGAAYAFGPLPGANLAMTKVADNPNPLPGGTLVFTLTATDQGPTDATGVVVTDTLPAGLTYSGNDCGAAFASSTLTWTIGDLANLASATCHLTVTIDAGASGAIVNTAAVDGNEFDPQVGDNAADSMLSFPMEYYTLTPCRLVDTRLADGPLGGPALAANVARDFVLAGACGVPAGAAAVVLNVTAVEPTAAGSVQIYRAGSTPLAGGSTVYYRAGVTRAGNGIVTLGAGGTVTALAGQPGGTVHLILDVAGYFL